MAYLELSRVAGDQGKPEEQRALLAPAAEYVDRLSEHDGWLVRAALAESQSQTEDALKYYDILMMKYPDE